MTTLYSAWVGSSVKGRIRCDYAVTYTADRTQAIFNGTMYVEFDQYLYDNYNAWNVNGDDGAHGGSNLAINTPSGGGIKALWGFNFQKYGDGAMSAAVTGIEAVGGATIYGSFTLDAGSLAPYLNNSNYTSRLVTTTGFTTTGISANGNGGTLNAVQMEVNTSASETGSTLFSTGSYGDAVATGLNPATLYYFRVRVRNSNSIWSAWGAWKTVTTISTVPGTPTTAWYISSTSQTTADIAGQVVTDTGGSAITSWDVQYSLLADPSTGTILSGAIPQQITGLTPGTTYYVHIRAVNANGAGAWSDVKSFTTLPGVAVKVGGVWKNAVPYVNVGGVWKPAVAYVNVGGVWKR